MSRLCLDTCAYSNFKRNHRPVVEAVSKADWVGVPSIVIGELVTSFRLGNRREENLAELKDFLSYPVVCELPVDHDVAEVYAELVATLRQAGTPIPTNDIWIAATSICAGSTLVTYDGHFSLIQRLGSWILQRPATPGSP